MLITFNNDCFIYLNHRKTNSELDPTQSVISQKLSQTQKFVPISSLNYEKPKENVEPVFQSIDRHLNRRYDSTTKSKVYDYGIKADAIDEENSKTFRDHNYDQYSFRVDTLRADKHVTPYKPKMTNSKFISPYNTNSSARKTVRFAESAEGLLKTVPFDPTFNDSDFVHDMKHI